MSVTRPTAAALLAGTFALTLGFVGAAALPPSAASADDVSGIEGTRWVLQELVMGNERTDVPDGVQVTLLLESGEASGNSGCNAYSSAYTLMGDALSFGPVMSTQMLCAEPSMSVETAYLGGLARVASFELDRDELTMVNSGGDTVLVFEAASTSALQGGWVVTSYRTAGRDLVSPQQGSLLTAIFGADGTIEGSSGCNHFAGSYTIDGDDLTIGPLSSTRMACAPPELQTQETDYLAALAVSNKWSLDGSELELVDSSGVGTDVTVTFSAESEASYLGAWEVTGYDRGNGSVATPVAGTTLTAVFTQDGTVEGYAGCNTFSGPYTVAGWTMTIGPLATTRVACSSADLDAQEQQYLVALQSVTSWGTDAVGITLRNSAGATLVALAPAAP